MKSLVTIFLSCLLVLAAYSQRQSFSNLGPDEVIRLNSTEQQFRFLPGEILVRFKDHISASVALNNDIATFGVGEIDQTLQRYRPFSAEKLFKDTKPLKRVEVFRTLGGVEIQRPSLHNIFKIKIREERRLLEAIEELKLLPEVLYAEPNGSYSLVSDPRASKVQSTMHPPTYGSSHHTNSSVIPNDPLFSQQWYLNASRIVALWDSTSGDTTGLIAILDSGVDWFHPDLANKIRINYAELNGMPGIDDDGNGFVDDIRGWDFINNDNDPRDDNSHGTHVAGIVAAEADNGIGIAGVDWRAKILPIKVLQSSGGGDWGSIAQGVRYAVQMGAKIINLSLGGYTESFTVRNALEDAYATSFIVAAAGNDGYKIDRPYPPMPPYAPFYPACYSFVFGVQASDEGGWRTFFSNFDPTGPILYNDGYYWNDFGYNYEMHAPGIRILSTIPNGNYRQFAGTSMASPVVAGVVSLLKSRYPTLSNEQMYARLIQNATGGNLDAFASLSASSIPDLYLMERSIRDTAWGGNGDGQADAGETVEFYLLIKNAGGGFDSNWAKLRLGFFEDSTVATVLDSMRFTGSISSYANRLVGPFRVTISPTVVNNRDIVFNYDLGYSNQVSRSGQIIINVKNAVKIRGTISGLLHLTPGKMYLVSDIAVVESLVISPGVELRISANMYLAVGSYFRAIGTPENKIRIVGDRGWWRGLVLPPNGNSELSNCVIEDGWTGGMTPIIQNMKSIQHTLFQNNIGLMAKVSSNTSFKYNVVKDNIASGYWIGGLWVADPGFENNIVARNRVDATTISGMVDFRADNAITLSIRNNVFIDNFRYALSPEHWWGDPGFGFFTLGPNYFGTIDSARVQASVLDFYKNPGYPAINTSSFLLAPPDSVHGVVWKVLINGINPQEFPLDPIGVSTVRFDVRFNREMDITATPQLTFGVREPFTQRFVADSSRWSVDRKVWTAYHTMNIQTGDGINTVRVAKAKDLDGFEIPIESTRFRFLIDAAGASSTGFSASAGLGKVNLEWDVTELPDVLGYNMYRFTAINDSTFTPRVLINRTLITDTTYTDLEVNPGTRYYYQYRTLRTNLSETDPSRIVSTVPLTSAMGDANGDLSVNVLDVIAMVSYILGQNPQPFIFAAADLNSDGVINVLDVIGVVNLILNPGSQGILATSGSARVDLVGGRLELTTDVPIAGMQFRLEGLGASRIQFTSDSLLSQFEVANALQGDSARTFVLFSLAGTTIPSGQHTLGTFDGLSPNIRLTDIVLSNSSGGHVVTSVWENGSPFVPTEYYLEQNFPNPFNASTTIQYGLPEKSEVAIVIFNILGQKVRELNLGEMNAGRHRVRWDGRNDFGNLVASGVYLYQFHTPNFAQVKKLVMIK
jgi:subtilisin family serine protease